MKQNQDVRNITCKDAIHRVSNIVRISTLLLTLLLSCTTTDNRNNAPAKKNRILVETFEYLGPPQYKWLVQGIRATVTNGLAKLQQFEVTSVAEQQKAAKLIQQKQLVGDDVDASKELAKINAVDYSCLGTIQSAGKELMVNVRIADATNANVKQSSNLKGTVDNPFAVQEKIVDSLVASLDVKLSDGDKALFSSYVTKNEEAFSLYSKAVETLYTDPKASAVLLANALSKDPEYLDALEDLSNALYQLGDYKRSLEYMNRKKTALEKKSLTETGDYANTLCNIGIIHLSLGDSDKALQLCNQDKTLKEKLFLSKSKTYATTLQSLSAIYIIRKESDKAIANIEQAKMILESLGLNRTHEFGDFLVTIGLAYKGKGDLEKANFYYSEADSLYKELGLTKTTSYSSVLSNQGLIHLAKKEYKDALKKFITDKEIQDNLKLTTTEEYAVTLSNLGLTLAELGQDAKAKELFNQAEKIKKLRK